MQTGASPISSSTPLRSIAGSQPAERPWLQVAARRVLARPRLWLGLWLLHQAVSLLSTLPLLLVLNQRLAHRPIASALARGQVDFLWAELLDREGGVVPSLVAALLFGLCLRWALDVSLSGGLLSTLLRPGTPGHVGRDGLLRRAAAALGDAWRLHGLSLLVLRLPLIVLWVGVAALIGRGHRPLLGSATYAVLHYAPLAVLAACAWSALSWVISLIQLERLTQAGPPSSLIRSIKAGLRRYLATRAGLRPLLLGAGLSVLLYSGWIVAGRLAAAALDVRLFVGAALLVRQLAAIGRSLISLWQLAAATELWHRRPAPETQNRI